MSQFIMRQLSLAELPMPPPLPAGHALRTHAAAADEPLLLKLIAPAFAESVRPLDRLQRELTRLGTVDCIC